MPIASQSGIPRYQPAGDHSVEIRGQPAHEIERHNLERALVRRAQVDARRHTGLVSFLPARGAQAPAVAGLQARETELGSRRREIVAAEARELEKFLRDLDADRVRAQIVVARVAAAVAEESRHRVLATRFERFPEYVDGIVHGDLAHAHAVSLAGFALHCGSSRREQLEQ